ncbi:hypothetical protein HanPSC8_Chr09g0378001 [Helianthus annuus]|nr:hypothetical protein HanPSC8_Chr09g0378001 [Helianthus annuus]
MVIITIPLPSPNIEDSSDLRLECFYMCNQTSLVYDLRIENTSSQLTSTGMCLDNLIQEA